MAENHSDRSPLITTRSGMSQNSGPGRFRMAITNSNQSNYAYFDKVFGCKKEILINFIFLFFYLLLYGLIYVVHYITVLTDYINLVVMGMHVLQFCVLFCQYLRACSWTNDMKNEGYLTLPSDLSFFRKSTIFIYSFFTSALCVLLSWSNLHCTKNNFCIIQLSQMEIIEIYLGIECFAVSISSVMYMIQICRYKSRHPTPDVIAESNQEALDLSLNRHDGSISGPTLIVTDELRIGEDFDHEGSESVKDSQTSLISYLRHKNAILSAKIYELKTQMQINNRTSNPVV